MIFSIVAALVLAHAQPERPGAMPVREVRLATSPDGLDFTESLTPIMVQGTAPDVLELTGAGTAGSKGTLLVYAVDSRRRAGGFVRLSSTDGGKTWSGPESVTVEGLASGVTAADPAVVQLPDGRLRLYFRKASGDDADQGEPPARTPSEPNRTPPPVRPPTPMTPDQPAWPIPQPRTPDAPDTPEGRPATGRQILSAVGDDGLHFTLEGGVRFQAPDLADPDIVYCARAGEGGQWLMFHSRGEHVRLARSRDGLAFEPDGVFDLPGGSNPAAVVLLDGRVRIHRPSWTGGITSAVYDPVTRTIEPDAGNRLGGNCTSPSVCPRLTGGYVMVFERRPGPR
jgi:hypothetical protein